MADMQFFGADKQFFMADMQFFAAGLFLAYFIMHSFAAGLLLVYKLCIHLLLDCFWFINYIFVSCLPLTEHVQSLYWACADIIDPVCDRFDR